MSSSSPEAKSKDSFVNDPRRALSKIYHSSVSVLFRLTLLCLGLEICHHLVQPSFMKYSHDMAQGMSMPSVMFKGQLQDGRVILVRDYMDAYEWVRETPRKTPGSWPGGIIATKSLASPNRTSDRDGNTWNHEHIANLARTLTAPEDEAYDVIRHLADYVRVDSGGSGDMAKSSLPHWRQHRPERRHRGHDGNPTQIWRRPPGSPSPMMGQFLLFKLVSFQVGVSEDHFEEVFTSKYRKVLFTKVVRRGHGISKVAGRSK